MSISMPKITPHLCFNDQAEEAVDFYVSIFKNSRVMNVTRYGQEEHGAEGQVRTVRFQIDGQELIATNGGPYFKFSDGISLYVSCDTQEEVDYLWEKLSEGGEKQECGWLKDKYGVTWEITPRIAWEMVNDPDPEKSQRVVKAIYKMEKLDAEKIKQASEGSLEN
ncbi:VOC family protein [Fictibacillus sp. NE201]|uniref:VOC family protein n=2 Tax=Fictibacillus fluitans TaxID=3058422 RepID=A0ABT8HYZ8_9BACL|nr:VOC family protein [Fictibacillus sp. NE201]MDN4525999.1 VOC family protein [Fictibacillus sp. NE201]